jgi:hypothetical protein
MDYGAPHRRRAHPAPRPPAPDLPLTEAPPRLGPATKADLVVALHRLAQILSNQLASAPRLGLLPDPDRLLRVVDAALDHAHGRPAPPATWGDGIEGHFLRGLLDELLQQPSNLFTGTRLLDGEEVPVPISADEWRECLGALRAAILRGDLALRPGHRPARYLGPARPGHLFIPASEKLRTTPGHPAPAPRLAALETWTRSLLDLAETDLVTITDLACRDPGCPLGETIISVLTEGRARRWKLAQPSHTLTRALLTRALARPPLA